MSTFLTAEWRKLIMAQYAVPSETLQPYLPVGLELDLFQNTCYVSLVGFLFDRVRLKGIPIPFHTRFEEVNLRFYVLRRDPPSPEHPQGRTRRGVVFISELVPRLAISLVANTLYQEPYSTVPTHSTLTQTPTALNLSYSWKHSSKWHTLAVEADPTPQPIAPASVEEFITEHYWGFTKLRPIRGVPTTAAYQVEHPRWQVYPIHHHAIDVDFAALYGPAFAPLNTRQPDNILLAEGSPVIVQSGSAESITRPAESITRPAESIT